MKRVITALFLVPAVVFIVLYTAAIWLLASVVAITILALVEYNRLTSAASGDRLSDYLVLLFGAAVPVLFFTGDVYFFPALAVIAAFAFFALGMIRSPDFKEVFLNASVKTFGVIYVALPFAYMVLLRNMTGGGRWIIFLFAVIWANDTFAMFVGKGLGRHKLSPLISPGKTIEGAAGGIVAGLVAAFLYDKYLPLGIGAGSLLLLSFAIGVVGIFGDLFESVIKRAAGVKDSGTIVPGHGGMLDRIDSLMFAFPLLYYYLTIGRVI